MLTVRTYLDKSSIHGIGLFAAEFIPAGTIMWKFEPLFDLVLEDEIIAKMSPLQKQFIHHFGYCDPTLKKFVLPVDDDRFTNFSKTPNTGPNITTPCNGTPPAYIALRDIQKGEEITLSPEDCLDRGSSFWDKINQPAHAF